MKIHRKLSEQNFRPRIMFPGSRILNCQTGYTKFKKLKLQDPEGWEAEKPRELGRDGPKKLDIPGSWVTYGSSPVWVYGHLYLSVSSSLYNQVCETACWNLFEMMCNFAVPEVSIWLAGACFVLADQRGRTPINHLLEQMQSTWRIETHFWHHKSAPLSSTRVS